MQVQPIRNNNPSFKAIRINSSNNRHCKYLYNMVLDAIKEEKVGGVFHPYHIVIDSEKQTLKDRLTNLGIKWFKNVTKDNK